MSTMNLGITTLRPLRVTRWSQLAQRVGEWRRRARSRRELMNLSHADLRGANLASATVAQADLRGADLQSASLPGLVAGAAGAATVSTGAEPPTAAALKAVVRTVTTFLASLDCTVSSALPA